MKALRAVSAAAVRTFAAAASGFLLALATPPFGSDLLAWIAFLPLFLALRKAGRRSTFLHALLSGVVYYSLAFQWTAAFHRWAIPIMCAISAVLFFALPLVLMRPFLRKPRMALALGPAIWVAFEFLKQAWFLRFPFGILGYSQYARLGLIQVADIGGVALVSWMILFVNVALYCGIEAAIAAGRFGRGSIAFSRWGAAAAACLALAAGYSAIRLRSLEFEKEPILKIGFAQTLFHPKKPWTEHQDEYLETIADLAHRLSGLGTDLILFPELTVDRFLTFEQDIQVEDNAEILNALSSLAREAKAGLLFGSLELRRVSGSVKTFNSMNLFSADGNIAGVYRKRILVPFGETNPFGAAFPALSGYLARTTDAADLYPGKEARLFSVERPGRGTLRFGTLICFEGAFGESAREYVRAGADFLVNATNDYWSLSTVAMRQHALMSVFRAIETRTPVLRISNGGFSCYVDERGRYASGLPLFREGVMTSRLYRLKDRPVGLYVRFGDWFAWVCILAAGTALFAAAFSCFGRKGAL